MKNTYTKADISLDTETLTKALRRGRSLRARCMRQAFGGLFQRFARWIRPASTAQGQEGHLV